MDTRIRKNNETRHEGNGHKPAYKMHRRCTFTRLLRGPVHCIKIAVFFHSPSENTVFGRIFYAQHTKASHNPAQNREKERDFPLDFRDFSDFWHSYPAVTFYEIMNASADVDSPSDVVGQGGEGKLGGDLFLPNRLLPLISPTSMIVFGQSDHNCTAILIQCVSGLRCSSFPGSVSARHRSKISVCLARRASTGMGVAPLYPAWQRGAN